MKVAELIGKFENDNQLVEINYLGSVLYGTKENILEVYNYSNISVEDWKVTSTGELVIYA